MNRSAFYPAIRYRYGHVVQDDACDLCARDCWTTVDCYLRKWLCSGPRKPSPTVKEEEMKSFPPDS